MNEGKEESGNVRMAQANRTIHVDNIGLGFMIFYFPAKQILPRSTVSPFNSHNS